MLNGLDLFSGAAGISAALHPYFRTVAYCESHELAQKILLSRMATGDIDDAPICTDVKTFHYPDKVGFIVAGFPCQGISIAGTRNGRKMLDDPRSGLFWHIPRIAYETDADVIFMENSPEVLKVEHIIRGVFESLGYVYKSTISKASDFGAVHQRKRWLALAHRKSFGIQELRPVRQQKPHALGESFLPVRTSDGQWQIEPDFRKRNDGLPTSLAPLRVVGNGVFPPQIRRTFEILAGLPHPDSPRTNPV